MLPWGNCSAQPSLKCWNRYVSRVTKEFLVAQMVKKKKIKKKIYLQCKGVWKSFSHIWLFATPWMVAHQVPLSMGISQARILEWVAIPFSKDLLAPGIKPRSPALQADSLLSKPPEKPIIQKTWVQFPRSGRSPGEAHSSILAWKILGTEEPGRL